MVNLCQQQSSLEDSAPHAKRSPFASVAIIIIGFNGADFLPSCLDSVLCQSHPADEIVYVDDGSTDDSVDVVNRWGRSRVKIVSLPENQGMCAARNAGADATQSTLLLFVDCDNTLPQDYLETMLEDMGGHEFVYPSKRFFGEPSSRDRRKLWEAPAADRRKLWEANYADTCSLMRRSTFESVGRWQTPTLTACDWHHALRMSRVGTHAKSRAVLNYRVHSRNWSRQCSSEGRERNVIIRTSAASLSIATVYSGRLPGIWLEWLRAVMATVLNAGKTAELIILDASPGGNIGDFFIEKWDSVQVRRLPGADAVARRKDARATAEFLAAAFNTALDASTGDVLWCIEDDTVPPLHACAEMLDALMQQPRAAVAGCYRNRHCADGWIAHTVQPDGRPRRWTEPPSKPTPVDLTGTGCLMLNKDFINGLRWQAEWRHAGRAVPSHDWHFSWELQQRGQPVLMLPQVICRHYQNEDVWV